VIPDKPLKSLGPCLVGRDGKPLVKNGVIDTEALESFLSEEELLDEEDEANMSLATENVQYLLHITFKNCLLNVSEIRYVRQSLIMSL